jgi:hypothetical protein
MGELYNNLLAAQSLAPAARTATANGTGVDLSGYHTALVLVDAGSWTDGTHALKLQESDDNSTFTDVGASDLIGSAPTISSSGTASKIYKFGYKGIKRYVRVVTTVSGTTTGAVYSAMVLRGNPRKAAV